MDYQLHHLSPRSFEHLTQALAIKYVGVGGLVFGDGSDGGREATFSGRTSYDTGDGPWDGYVVLQAKFRQRPLGAAKDGKWVLKQLKAELEDFVKEGSARRLPEYYILATNVTLTPTQESGAKDRVESALADSGLELKGWDVWDYDKLRTFLDDAPDIVRTYFAWIGAGDVLKAAVEQLERATPEFERTLARYLQNELLSDQYANLEQAGHSPDERVPMAGVFVDLPVVVDEDDTDSRSLFVRQMLGRASERLSPSCFETEAPEVLAASRVALVGGPGQGKTTLGQFICQLFRAAILADRDPLRIEADARAVVDLIGDWCQRDGYELPSVRRFPLRVSLSEFAAALAGETPTADSLLSYLAKRIGRRTDTTLDASLFRAWLESYPWLLVLDGLDEVPPSSNRDAVLREIKSFLIEIADADADVLVLATTRPQGYNDDFSPRIYNHRYLVPLEPDEAMQYGERLSHVRFGENPDRVEKVTARLNVAVANEATARLMTSPLQVTIMTILVDQQGHPPQERWSLFSAYYSAIYSRELERDVPSAAVLREHKADVDAIHERVGLILQAESERAAGTDARLSVARFTQIVRQRLREEGHDGEAIEELQARIVEAAANRLVFLVGLESGLVGFEIRSLQEFMAAEGLMEGTDAQVRDRLAGIATSPSWRNVFLFAAGRCFAERQHLRDTIQTLAAELNEPGNPPLDTILAGSRLALDILEDGSANRQPKYRALFTRLAMRLLELPPEESQPRVAATYTEPLRAVFEGEVTRLLSATRFEERLGSWNCLLTLANRGTPWARELVRQGWPDDSAQGCEVFKLLGTRPPAPEVMAAATAELLRQPPWTFQADPTPLAALARAADSPDWVAAFARLHGRRSHYRHQSTATLGAWGGVTFVLGHLSSYEQLQVSALTSVPAGHPSWILERALGRFLTERTHAAAAAALRAMSTVFAGRLPMQMRSAAGVFDSELMHVATWPWPLVALFFSAPDAADVEFRAQRLEAGQYGGFDEWASQERDWDSSTVDFLKLAESFDPESPLQQSAQGAPPLAAVQWTLISYVMTDQMPSDLLARLIQLPEPGRSLAAWSALQVMSFEASAGDGTPRHSVRDWCTLRRHTTLPGLPLIGLDSLEHIVRRDPNADAALGDLDEVSATMKLEPFSIRRPTPHLQTLLYKALDEERLGAGLRRLLALTYTTTRLRDVELPASTPSDEEEDAFVDELLSLSRREPSSAAHTLRPFLISRSFRLEIVTGVAVTAELSQDWLVEYLLTTLAGTPSEHSTLRQNLVESLGKLVGRRVSPLSDARWWAGRGLPTPPPSEA
jgi:hypothetical protein